MIRRRKFVLFTLISITKNAPFQLDMQKGVYWADYLKNYLLDLIAFQHLLRRRMTTLLGVAKSLTWTPFLEFSNPYRLTCRPYFSFSTVSTSVQTSCKISSYT